jgi:hypothetical protein
MESDMVAGRNTGPVQGKSEKKQDSPNSVQAVEEVQGAPAEKDQKEGVSKKGTTAFGRSPRPLSRKDSMQHVFEVKQRWQVQQNFSESGAQQQEKVDMRALGDGEALYDSNASIAASYSICPSCGMRHVRAGFDSSTKSKAEVPPLPLPPPPPSEAASGASPGSQAKTEAEKPKSRWWLPRRSLSSEDESSSSPKAHRKSSRPVPKPGVFIYEEEDASSKCAACTKSYYSDLPEPCSLVSFFNMAPLKAIQYLQRERILEPGGAAIAAFLRTTRGLCTRACGEILRESVSNLGDISGVHCQADHQDEEDEESRCSDCCMLYALGFCFDATPFEIALRFFLGRFRMPGEAQKISRILTSFARSYYRDNPRSFRCEEGAFLLAYSAVMLNVDAHNPNLQGHKRMSREQFVRNNRGIDGGKDIDTQVLHELFASVSANQLTVAEEAPKELVPGEMEILFDSGSLGLELETGIGPQTTVIKRLQPGGQGSKKGLTVGRVLVAINGESVINVTFRQTMWQLKRAMRPLVLRFRKAEAFHRGQRERELSR